MRDVVFLVGYMLHVPAALAASLVPISASLDQASASAAYAFAATAAVALLAGQGGLRLGSRPRCLELNTAMAAAALGWLLVSVVGALPFLWIAHAEVAAGTASDTLAAFTAPVTALFESMSGFTSTGLTMAARESELPPGLQLWRSLSQWAGGFGIAILVIALADPSGRDERLFETETNASVFGETATWTAGMMLAMYAVFTLAAVLALRWAGLTVWDAVNYGLTGVSTGGFGTTDDSFADQPRAGQVVMMVIMVMGAISFATYFRGMRQGPRALLSNQAMALLAGIAILSLLLALVFAARGSLSGAMDVVFQAVSAFTTAGFSTTDLTTWSTLAMALLGTAMIIGAGAGSTGGGFKLARFLLLARATGKHLSHALRRPTVLFGEADCHRRDMDRQEANRLQAATTLLLLWLSTLAVGSFCFAVFSGAPLADALFDATSALGGVGLSSGAAIAELPVMAKLTLIVLMWLGRLEIIPGLVLVSRLAQPSVRRTS